MADVSFGQYYPSNSFVHKCDPRLKILFFILYMVLVFVANNFYALGVLALVFIVITIVAKIPFKQLLRTLKNIWFLLLFTVLLNLFVYAGKPETDTLWWEWGILKIWDRAVYLSTFLACRLVLLVFVSSLLTFTTSPVALTDGLESLLSPLKLIKFPVHALALIMSLALRMIPILSEETSRIINAQKARGADFETGGLIKRVKAIVPILIPLLISAFRRSQELGDAMDARCYSGSTVRTKYKKLTFGYRDLIATLFALIFLAAVILLRIFVVPII
ncbi:MAG: energy-coupling factor transporter transmembrane protein EcfT, partial [Clostridia bacterium]|nr:energy-coupling factor transporter transmembrane protein EcfT [Clostridia bacterium]